MKFEENKMQHDFPTENEGRGKGGKGRLELFRKLIQFVVAIHPPEKKRFSLVLQIKTLCF